MISLTFWAVAGATTGESWRTLLTVAMETPAASATSRIDTERSLFSLMVRANDTERMISGARPLEVKRERSSQALHAISPDSCRTKAFHLVSTESGGNLPARTRCSNRGVLVLSMTPLGQSAFRSAQATDSSAI